MAVMRHQIEVAFEPIGTKLLDRLTPHLKKASEMAANFTTKLAEMSPAQQISIAKYALMAAAAGPVILTLGRVQAMF